MNDALEGEIEAVARRLAAAGEGKQVGAFHLGWWSEQMLEWAFTHPEFKTQLFRFVDVFPQCRDAADVLRHMSEYFDGVPVPRAVELGLDVAEQVPLGSVVSAAVARRNIRRMARQFIAGEDPTTRWSGCAGCGTRARRSPSTCSGSGWSASRRRSGTRIESSSWSTS